MSIFPIAPVMDLLIAPTGASHALPLSDYFGFMKNVKNYGIVGDGKTDDQPAFAKFLANNVSAGDIIFIPPGNYHLGTEIALAGANKVTVYGYGAIFDERVRVTSQQTKLYGIEVDGSSTDGFQFERGQESSFYDLRAVNCTSAGFLVGGTATAQVARATFINCFASTNGTHGWDLDGTGGGSNFVNANLFLGCHSRTNVQSGIFGNGTVNYNTWICANVEGNDTGLGGDLPINVTGAENSFIGIHGVDTQATGTSLSFTGSDNVFVGGRYTGDVTGANWGKANVTTGPELFLAGGSLASFQFQIINTAGTLQHRISAHGSNTDAATNVGSITLASTTLTNTPTGTDASTAFATGAKVSTDSTNSIIFDTAEQNVNAQTYLAQIVLNDTGTALSVQARRFSNDVNGTTRGRFVLTFYDAASGAAFAINTTNITSGKQLLLQVYGFID